MARKSAAAAESLRRSLVRSAFTANLFILTMHGVASDCSTGWVSVYSEVLGPPQFNALRVR